jgi:7,8-dihydropterin-6-yl-methyl-4-(beta-D-ribofuranosyl)aminobenzene 5'-phosphate synthase
MSEVSVTILADNTVNQTGLKGEHGLSIWIERDQESVLFDTGQTTLFADNAEKLGIDIAAADAIAISHGHYDHVGGLGQALQVNRNASIHLHSDAFKPHYSGSKDIGVPLDLRRCLEAQGGRIARYDHPVEIAAGFFLTGQIPRKNAWEDTGGPFFHDGANQQPDHLLDDQVLYFNTTQGTVIVCGCSHAGVANTVQYVQELTGQRPIACLVGGLHLARADAQRMRKTLKVLGRLKVAQVVPLHCTGFQAKAHLSRHLGERLVLRATGDKLLFQV